MTHARPTLVQALRTWGLGKAVRAIEDAPSLGALKLMAFDAYAQVRRSIRFRPVRRDLFHALNTLHAAATFAGRGDAENTAAVVIGVFTGAASARSWRRPWTRLHWRERRAEVIATARREQNAQRAKGQAPAQ
jgi:hypothetical protein